MARAQRPVAIMGLWFFRVSKSFGQSLPQLSNCMKEEIETQKDRTNWSADFPASVFHTQISIRLSGEELIWQLVLFKREILEVTSLFYIVLRKREGKEEQATKLSKVNSEKPGFHQLVDSLGSQTRTEENQG